MTRTAPFLHPSFSLWICSSCQKGMESPSPSLWLASDKRMWQLGQCASSEPRPLRSAHFCSLLASLLCHENKPRPTCWTEHAGDSWCPRWQPTTGCAAEAILHQPNRRRRAQTHSPGEISWAWLTPTNPQADPRLISKNEMCTLLKFYDCPTVAPVSWYNDVINYHVNGTPWQPALQDSSRPLSQHDHTITFSSGIVYNLQTFFHIIPFDPSITLMK